MEAWLKLGPGTFRLVAELASIWKELEQSVVLQLHLLHLAQFSAHGRTLTC